MHKRQLFRGSMMRSVLAVLPLAMSLMVGGCFEDSPAQKTTNRQSPQGFLKTVPVRSVSETSSTSMQPTHRIRSLREYYFPTSDFVPSPQDLDLPRVISADGAPHLTGPSGKKTVATNRTLSGFSRRGVLRSSPTAGVTVNELLGQSFESLFANVFNQTSTLSTTGDLPNPFADPLKGSLTEKGQSAQAAADPSSTPKQSTPAPAPSTPATDPEPNPVPPNGNGLPSTNREFVFLGDFDGSGTLVSAKATRTGNATFAFDDGKRSFVILDNPAAVETQRSFAVEDMDGDGNLDLLQTSRAALFGSVFRGDGKGNFNYSGYFLTGYEPAMAVPGPMGDSGREILVVDLRTGDFTGFRASGIYTPYRLGTLGFVPDYLAHLVQLTDLADYLLAAQTAGSPHLYQWLQGTNLADSGQEIQCNAAITLTANSPPAGAIGALQVFQIGAYASVLLTNNQGQTFNVANLHVAPQIFLVIGNLENQGTLDVGIAFLIPTSPVNQ